MDLTLVSWVSRLLHGATRAADRTTGSGQVARAGSGRRAHEGVLVRLVDAVVAAAKVGDPKARIPPARPVVCCTVSMIMFVRSSHPEAWVTPVGRLDWARSFRDRVRAPW